MRWMAIDVAPSSDDTLPTAKSDGARVDGRNAFSVAMAPQREPITTMPGYCDLMAEPTLYGMLLAPTTRSVRSMETV